MIQSEDILKLFKAIKKERVVHIFYGSFNFNTINLLLKSLKKELNPEKANNTQKKTYRIAVECIENSHKHVAEKSNKLGLFILAENKKGFNIIIGNTICKKEVSFLKNKIDLLNSLNLIELKEKHNQALESAIISPKGGAGVGLIEIAIKSENKLDYIFTKNNKEIDFFILNINIT